MSPYPRKRLSLKSKSFQTRFAIRLRELLDARGIGPTEFVARLRAAGLDVSKGAVKKWLSGDRVPAAEDAEKIGRVLGLKDYREVWPMPL